VLQQRILGVEDAVVEGGAAVQVEQDVAQEMAVEWILLCGEESGI
jgi:hypothetical protein